MPLSTPLEWPSPKSPAAGPWAVRPVSPVKRTGPSLGTLEAAPATPVAAPPPPPPRQRSRWSDDVSLPVSGHSWWFTGCVLLDDEYLISSSYDKSCRVWDLRNGSCKCLLNGHGSPALCVYRMSDGRVVSGSLDKTVKVWQLRDGDTSCSPCLALRGHTDAVRAVGQLAGDGRIWSASDDGTVRVWSASDGRQSAVLRVGAAVLAVAQLGTGGGDRPVLLTGSVDGALRMWRIPAASATCVTLSPTTTLPGAHAGGITCMCVLPPAGGHHRVATGGMDGCICTWDVTAGVVVARNAGHNGAITGLTVVPPHGACDPAAAVGMLASVSMDRTIRLWGPGSTSEGVMRGHTHWINAVLFHPVTGHLITAGADRTLRWWQRPDYADGGAWTCVRVLPAERRVSTHAAGGAMDAADVVDSRLTAGVPAVVVTSPDQDDAPAVMYSPSQGAHEEAPAQAQHEDSTSKGDFAEGVNRHLVAGPASSRPPVAAAAAAGVAAAVAAAVIAFLLASKRGQHSKAQRQDNASSRRMQRRAQRRARGTGAS